MKESNEDFRVAYNVFSEVSGDILLDIYSSGRVTPHLNRPIHYHTNAEIALIKSGKGKIKINDKIIDIKTDDILICKSMEPHRIIQVESKNVMKVITISFPPKIILTNSCEWIDKRLVNLFFEYSDDFNNKLDNDNPNKEAIRKIIVDIEKELVKNKTQNSFIIKAKFLEILARLVHVYNCENNSNQILRSKYLDSIDDTLIYINEHLCEDISLETLAKIAHMGLTYYSAVFKKIQGVSPWQYVLCARTELAIKYLTDKETNYSITEIACMCGFNNMVNFNKIFKKITGKTPTEYKKQQ